MSPKEREAPSIESNAPSAEPIEIFPEQQETQTQTFKKTSLMLQVEKEIKVDLPEFLKRKYLTSAEIAEELGVSRRTVRRWMKNLGFETGKSGRITRGHIRVNKENKLNLVEQARAQGSLEMLTAKEQFVINARFPTEGKRVKLAQISQELYPNRPVPVSRENIRQIQERALGKLERELNKVRSFG